MPQSALDFRVRRADHALFITSHPTLTLSVTLLATAGSALADDAPLVLSSQHLGMTRTEVESTAPLGAHEGPLGPIAPYPSDVNPSGPTAPDWGSEFVSNEGQAPEGCVGWPLAASDTTVGSFGQCIEMSIRGGVGYDESALVCDALFPGQS